MQQNHLIQERVIVTDGRVYQMLKNYIVINEFARGALSVVLLALDSTNNYEKVAIKCLSKSYQYQNPKLIEIFKSEASLLKQISNPHVVRFVDYFEDKDFCYLVVEYCDEGNLYQIMQSRPNGRFSEKEAVKIFKQILTGFQALHEKHIIHRDIKLENILMSNGVVKIADLGVSKQLNNLQEKTTTKCVGTLLTMAPEVYFEFEKKESGFFNYLYQLVYGNYTKSYGIYADLYSLGVVLYTMLFQQYPFDGDFERDILESIKQNRIKFNVEGVEVSDSMKDLISRMLRYDSSKRIRWADVYSHPALTAGIQLQAVGDVSVEIMLANSQFYLQEENAYNNNSNNINSNSVVNKPFDFANFSNHLNKDLLNSEVDLKIPDVEEIKRKLEELQQVKEEEDGPAEELDYYYELQNEQLVMRKKSNESEDSKQQQQQIQTTEVQVQDVPVQVINEQNEVQQQQDISNNNNNNNNNDQEDEEEDNQEDNEDKLSELGILVAEDIEQELNQLIKEEDQRTELLEHETCSQENLKLKIIQNIDNNNSQNQLDEQPEEFKIDYDQLTPGLSKKQRKEDICVSEKQLAFIDQQEYEELNEKQLVTLNEEQLESLNHDEWHIMTSSQLKDQNIQILQKEREYLDELNEKAKQEREFILEGYKDRLKEVVLYKDIFNIMSKNKNNSDLVSKRILVLLLIKMKDHQYNVLQDLLKLNKEFFEFAEVQQLVEKLKTDEETLESEIEQYLVQSKQKKEDFFNYINAAKNCNRPLLNKDIKNELTKSKKYLDKQTFSQQSILFKLQLLIDQCPQMSM